MRRRLGSFGTISIALAMTASAFAGSAEARGAHASDPAAVDALRQSPVAAEGALPPRHRGSGVVALDWGDLDDTPAPATADYLVMQPWEYDRIPALRAANPGLRILMYKDASATVPQAHETGLYPTGVGWPEAQAHPGWFLRDRTGQRLEWSDWRGLYPMNVARPAYQNAWAGNVLAELRAHDWDGVSIDDTLTYLSHPTVGDRVSTQIPDDDAMYRATTSFLAHVGPRLRDAGYLAIPNVTVEWNTWRSTLTDWSRYVSGWENEYFVKWGLDRQPRFENADWAWKMRMAAWCAARGLPLLAITYSDSSDLAAMTYHRATWLLTWNGRTGASIFVPAEFGASHWSPRANTYLGVPTGVRQRTGGVWTRTFTHGMVLVNPTARWRQARVGPGHRTLNGTSVTTVRLPPRSGRLLRH